jgi:hypothetical protein
MIFLNKPDDLQGYYCLQEEPDEHGQGKWEGKQKVLPAYFAALIGIIPRSSIL